MHVVVAAARITPDNRLGHSSVFPHDERIPCRVSMAMRRACKKELHVKNSLIALGSAALASILGLGTASQPERRSSAGPPKEALVSADPAIAALAFLQGTWRGTMDGDPVEETWSAPAGDSIIGMFRWQHDGTTTLWELLSIKVEEGRAVLRLRHFDEIFEPWKGECDGVAAMKATTVEEHRVVFTNTGAIGALASCEYDASTPGILSIRVSFKPDRQREPLRFILNRTP
jgi:hypothetical protein